MSRARCECCVVPPGLGSDFPRDPALKRWAKLFRRAAARRLLEAVADGKVRADTATEAEIAVKGEGQGRMRRSKSQRTECPPDTNSWHSG
jgi:hypothetical protein